MKTFTDYLKKTIAFSLTIFSVFLFISCGTHNNNDYEADGIYSTNENSVVENDTSADEADKNNYYKQYFKTKELTYSDVPDDNAIFTDVEAYHATESLDEEGYVVVENDGYDEGYGAWGSNVTEVSINVYGGFGYSPYYYGGWGMSYGWGYPYYSYGWGYPYYGYGWGYPYYGYSYPYYGYGGYYNNYAYNRGRRNTDYYAGRIASRGNSNYSRSSSTRRSSDYANNRNSRESSSSNRRGSYSSNRRGAYSQSETSRRATYRRSNTRSSNNSNSVNRNTTTRRSSSTTKPSSSTRSSSYRSSGSSRSSSGSSRSGGSSRSSGSRRGGR